MTQHLGAFESSPPAIMEPQPVPAAESTIERVFLPSPRTVATQPSANQTPPIRRSTPSSFLPPGEGGQDDAGTKPSPTVSSLTKEAKAAEMARKKDERKQVRIIYALHYNVH
jgi:SCY1-like protein 1